MKTVDLCGACAAKLGKAYSVRRQERLEVLQMDEETIYGVRCAITQERFPGGERDVYRFAAPGWPECCVTGRKAAMRTIRGRLDPAVRNTLGIDRVIQAQKEAEAALSAQPCASEDCPYQTDGDYPAADGCGGFVAEGGGGDG